MSILSITSSGDFDKTSNWLAKLSGQGIFRSLDSYAQRGVAALSAATPEDSGASASSWSYEIKKSGANVTISWTNHHVDKTGTPIVIMLQYGHGTGTGGYVQGRDFINPAIKPIFEQIADSVWKEVMS